MKATGIVRRIDDLGRVVVPKEIRKVLRIREGDPLEIYTGTSGEVILKKYSPIGELGQVAESFAESVSSTLGLPVMVSDTDRYVAVSGMKNRDYINRNIDEELDDIIQHKSEYNTDSKVIVPILLNGDPIGSVTILPSDGEHLTDLELKTARLGAGFLGKQMES
ncbi:MAG: stage V sporulation T C-terminal domain-containing protein [Anaerovoracaceae bacterium]|nr:stage V sporulation T C-terminal domain-containing protein [Anaerovoracaceae bacterium]